jgi:hypothetical protein
MSSDNPGALGGTAVRGQRTGGKDHQGRGAVLKMLAEALQGESREIGARYPGLLLQGQVPKTPRCQRKRSRITGADSGLFADEFIRKGELIGILGGKVTMERNNYAIEVSPGVLVDSTPTGNRDHTIFGYINDYIWDDEKQNCELRHGAAGIITAKNYICHMERCTSHIGMEPSLSG